MLFYSLFVGCDFMMNIFLKQISLIWRMPNKIPEKFKVQTYLEKCLDCRKQRWKEHYYQIQVHSKFTMNKKRSTQLWNLNVDPNHEAQEQKISTQIVSTLI